MSDRRRVFLGCGLIGAALAEAAVKRGEPVRVWNRSPGRTEALAGLGAEVADDIAGAIAGCRRVHLALTADAAVDAVLEQVRAALADSDQAAGTILIDHSTVSPEGAAARARRCREQGLGFLHAPVFMSPGACRAATGVMVVGGPRALFDQVEDELDRMTGEVWYVGDGDGDAATMKLIGNVVIIALIGGLSDALTVGAAHGITPEKAFELFRHFNPTGAIMGRGERMSEGDFRPHWTLGMALKDVRLALAGLGEAGSKAAVLPGLAQRMEALIGEGAGGRDLGALARHLFADESGDAGESSPDS